MSRDLDGAGGYLNLDNGDPLSTTGGWTISAWVYLDAPQNLAAIFTHQWTGGPGLPSVLAIGSSGSEGPAGRWYAGWYTNGTNWVTCSDSIGCPTAQWVHLAATCRGAGVSTPGEVRLYRNGTLLATSGSNGSAQSSAGGNDVYIGKRWDNPNYIDGKLAEVAVWMNKDVADVGPALSAAEIGALSKGINPTRFRRNYLKLYLPMWGLASPEADLSGNRLNFTLNGTGPKAAHPPVERMAA